MAHKVKIKNFAVEMEVKTKGVEFQVHIDDAHQGDLIISKSGPQWCPGRTKAGNGIKISWKDFIVWAESHSPG